ncbi:T9SS type A sorting domain-containing protein [candidate division KSB1 bacterium]|nr:T9SS type A sorting domain-containing protein [candidate division KSB1 bacterium]
MQGLTLYPNWPNPFNTGTTISYDLRKTEPVTLKIVNMVGQEVIRLVTERIPMGSHTIYWQGRDQAGSLLPSGAYYVQLQAGKYVVHQKLLLIR